MTYSKLTHGVKTMVEKDPHFQKYVFGSDLITNLSSTHFLEVRNKLFVNVTMIIFGIWVFAWVNYFDFFFWQYGRIFHPDH